jgi:hypothetical protein
LSFLHGQGLYNPLEWLYISNKLLPAEIIFKVGQPGFPLPGSNIFESPQIINRSVIIARNSLIQWSKNLEDGNNYFEHEGNRITFFGPLEKDETITIIIL